MMRTLLIDAGAAETLGALRVGGEIVKFWFLPGRGDEARQRAVEAGDIVLGRIKTAAPSLGGAFVDIGASEDVFLRFRAGSLITEGSLHTLRVVRPAIGAKAAVLDAEWKASIAVDGIDAGSAQAGCGPPRILTPVRDAAVSVAHRASAFAPGDIVVNRPEAARALAAAGYAARIDERAVNDGAIADALEAALEHHVPIGDGGAMIFDETEGGVIIDIDAGAAANASRAPNDRINERAATMIFRELSRRAIGGRVMIDFLPPSSPSARKRLLDTISAQDHDLYERRIGKLAPDGLLDMTAPRRDRSLLERASEAAGDGWLRKGRQLSLDWTARRAISAAEHRLARAPRAQLVLDAGSDLVRYLDERAEWIDRLRERYGNRLSLNATAPGGERRYDVREIRPA